MSRASRLWLLVLYVFIDYLVEVYSSDGFVKYVFGMTSNIYIDKTFI